MNLFLRCGALCSLSIVAFSQTQQTPTTQPAPQKQTATNQNKTTEKSKVPETAKTKLGMAFEETKTDSNKTAASLNPFLRKYLTDKSITTAFFQGVPPASCAEWSRFSGPPVSVDTNCKELGGKRCCARCNSPSYDLGPSAGGGKVGQPFKVHLRIRHLGMGDYIIYGFGKIDWGDNSQQDVFPLGQDIELAHTYDTATTFTVHVMGGAQFKYDGDGSCSYECCVDNSIPVQITP